MKVVAVVSQKGGAGKTTLAVHLATCAHLAGFRTALVDLDPQATARSWGDRRQAKGPEVVSDHASRLGALLQAAKGNGADLVVVDTAPNADQAALGAVKAADLVIIPCRPAAFDLEAVEATLGLATITRKPAWVVLNAAPNRGRIAEEAKAGLEERGAQCAPTVMCQRVAYSHSVIDGRTALEFEPDGKAAEEVRDLFRWTCRQVGMSTRPHRRAGATGRSGT
ncbi:MAG TPA: ParA family partition ATPase [Acetobacteraceae bacterium]|nr:ParA family partition ATPase [Acetobacteraceae bacterium]